MRETEILRRELYKTAEADSQVLEQVPGRCLCLRFFLANSDEGSTGIN